MIDEINELTVIADIVVSEQTIESIVKTFNIIDSESLEDDIEPKTIDEIITGFLTDIETKAKENGFEIKDKERFYIESTMDLILFFIKHDSDSITIKIPVVKEEEKGDKEDEYSDEQ